MKEIANKSLNILLVDDNKIFINGIKFLLKQTSGLSHIHEALNGNEALEIIKKQDIDIIITDINMPEMSGVELSRIIKTNHPNLKIIVISIYNNKAIVNEMIEIGVEGYLLKNTDKHELIDAINNVAEGGKYYCEDILEKIVDDIENT